MIHPASFKPSALSRILAQPLKLYRKLTIHWAPSCRFYPSCSLYALECLEKEHLLKAVFKIVWRLLRCGPWHPGGHDPA